MTVPMNSPASSEAKPHKPVRARPAASPSEQALVLRDSLRTAARQAGDLAKSLRHQKRQARIVESTLASLKQLQKAAG
jgi:hypothetical protein